MGEPCFQSEMSLILNTSVQLRPHHSLVEVRFGDRQEAAVSHRSDSEDEGFTSQHGELADQLTGVGHKQPRLDFTVDHPLVNVEEARNNKQDAHLLKNDRTDRHLLTNILSSLPNTL